MLGVVIAFVETARFPVYIVLFLMLAVADPKEAHVECLGTFLLESIMRESDRSSVVRLDWGAFLGLFMTQILQTCPNRNTIRSYALVPSGSFGPSPTRVLSHGLQVRE